MSQLAFLNRTIWQRCATIAQKPIGVSSVRRQAKALSTPLSPSGDVSRWQVILSVPAADVNRAGLFPLLFGEKLRLLREERVLLQRELAPLLGFATESAVSRLEAAERAPSTENILRASHIFNVLPEYFLFDSIAVIDFAAYRPEDGQISVLLPDTFGERLRVLRAQHNLTQDELATKLGISRSHLTNIELGRKQVVPRLLAEIVSFFQVTVLTMFSRASE